MTAPRIAVLGAGPSGIAAAKECIQMGLGDGLAAKDASIFQENAWQKYAAWQRNLNRGERREREETKKL